MARAFPERSDCPDVPDNEAISGEFVTSTILCEPPDPIFEFPVYEFPPPDPPSFDFGCYEPSISTLFEISTNPLFEGEVDFENSDETGHCEPKFKFRVKIPPCVTATSIATTSIVPGLTTPSASLGIFKNTEVGDICRLRFKLRLYFPDSTAGCTSRVASTGSNVTLSGGQTVDGVSVGTGDTVLAKDQTNPAENGVYAVDSGGAWTRTCSMVPGLIVAVRGGTQNGGSAWILTTEDPITVGTTPLTFEPVGSSCCCSARVATTTNILLTGLQTIDGVSVAAGDVVLVKDQTTGSENGPYIAASGAWERTCQVETGHVVSVREGQLYTNTLWMLRTNAPITLDTTSLSYRQVVDRPSARVAVMYPVTLSGTATHDGVSLAVGDVILVAGQASAPTNGLYQVQSGAWNRVGDITGGMIISIREGSVYGNQAFLLTTNNPITLGATSLTFRPLRLMLRAAAVLDRGVFGQPAQALSGTPTLDDYATVSGDVVVVMNHTVAGSNGVYVINGTTWSKQLASTTEFAGTMIVVRNGTRFGRGPFMVIGGASQQITGMTAFVGPNG